MTISLSLVSMRRPVQALGAAVLLAGLAACGGTSGSTTTPATTPSPSATSSAAAPSGSTSSAAPANTDAPVPVESNPPGDIPDNLAFVSYTNKVGGYTFTHPEGWAQTGTGTQVLFTDKLNGVAVDSLKATTAPTVASAKSDDVPRLLSSVPAFELVDVSAVTVPGGDGVRIVFRRNSEPDEVTGKVFRDEVEEYVIYQGGRLVRMDLYGPVGADNVDAYVTMSQSLSIG